MEEHKRSLQYQTQLGKSSQLISEALFHRENPQRKNRYQEYLVLLWWNYSPFVWIGVASLDSLMVCLCILSLAVTIWPVVQNRTLAVLLNLLFHCHLVIIDSIPSVHLPSHSNSTSPQNNRFCAFPPHILYMQSQEFSGALNDPDGSLPTQYILWFCNSVLIWYVIMLDCLFLNGHYILFHLSSLVGFVWFFELKQLLITSVAQFIMRTFLRYSSKKYIDIFVLLWDLVQWIPVLLNSVQMTTN